LTSLMASRFVGGGAEPGEGVKSFILPRAISRHTAESS
jgi:hypothetical protein